VAHRQGEGHEGARARAGSPRSLPLRLVDAWVPDCLRDGDAEILERARIIVGFTLALVTLGIETALFYGWALTDPARRWVLLAVGVGLILTLLIPAALRRHRLAAATQLLLGACFVVILTVQIMAGGVRAPLLHWFALLPMLALLLGARRLAPWWAGLCAATLIGLAGLEVVGFALENHLHVDGRSLWLQRLVDVGSWIGILYAVAVLHARNREERAAALGARNEELYREVAQRKAAEERTRFLAYHDHLTKLTNREYFNEQLRDALDCAREQGLRVGLLFVDLDDFKEVNDSHGHGHGDLLLQHVARRLANCIRAADSVSRGSDVSDGRVVSRLGGDEFTILLADIRSHEEAAIVCRRILGALRKPMDLEGREFHVSASIGVALFPSDASGLDGLMRSADRAMYQAKARGGNNYQFFEETLNDAAQRRSALVGHLRGAVERDEFVLEYQPILGAGTGGFVALEALIRWVHPDRGLLSPAEFLEIAEETGLVVPIGRWVLRQACRQWRSLRDAGMTSLRMSINVSGAQLRDPSLAPTLAAALREFGIPSKSLELEITENAMMEDEEQAGRALQELKSHGVRIALDDFGTGYSSLSYVKRFPVDSIKIDRSFVHELADDPDARAIITAIIAMAHELDLTVVAEGVETEAQERFLRDLHCDELQGFRFARPQRPDALLGILTDPQRR
jgi:diguanylate cyclase (GGDEF)-like protein